MKNFALKIVRTNFPELVRSNRIKKLSKELLLDILEDLSVLFTKPVGSSNNISLSLSTSSYQNTLSSQGTHYVAQTPANSPSLLHPQHQNNLLQNLYHSLLNDEQK